MAVARKYPHDGDSIGMVQIPICVYKDMIRKGIYYDMMINLIMDGTDYSPYNSEKTTFRDGEGLLKFVKMALPEMYCKKREQLIKNAEEEGNEEKSE